MQSDVYSFWKKQSEKEDYNGFQNRNQKLFNCFETIYMYKHDCQAIRKWLRGCSMSSFNSTQTSESVFIG